MISAAAQTLADRVIPLWKPPARLKTSEWAEKNRWLSPESAAESAGGGTVKYHGDRAPYQRGPMDAVHEPGIRKVVMMFSGQSGKSTILENIMGRFLHLEPCPMIVMLPTVDMGQGFSKERISPMCRDTPPLREIFPPAKSRDSSNTILTKHGRNGAHIVVVGANAPGGLSMRPRRALFADEIDRMKESAGTEGDPLSLAEVRLSNYYNNFEVLTSTPANAETSAITREFEASDKRYFHVPCPNCGEYIVLEYRNLRWETEAELVIPESVEYRCQVCGCKIDRSDQPQLLAGGDWIPTAPTRDVAGFHLWRIYSPWSSWVEIAEKRHACGHDPNLLKVFWNTYLALPWEQKGETVGHEKLLNRLEDYGADLPQGAVLLVAGVDTQDDRLEVSLWAFGDGEESWAIAHYVIDGDPADNGAAGSPGVWTRLDDVLFNSRYCRPDGAEIPVTAACVDSAGHRTTAVYEYCRARRAKHVLAIIGKGGEGRPVIGAPSKKASGSEKTRTKVWIVGTDEAKSILYSRMNMEEPGQGYIHFPNREEFNEDYFKQLTAEVKVPAVKNGRQSSIWKLRAGRRRNEALDCAVYALAAMRRVNPNWEAWGKRVGGKQEEDLEPDQESGRAPRRRPERRSSFVNSWRK